MQLTLWTYEGPPHVGAMRVVTAMQGVHYVLHAPQGDTYADLLFTMIERRDRRPPVTYSTFQARDLGGDTAALFQTAARDAVARFQPQALLVGASCTAELIQDDPGGLAEALGLDIPVIPLERTMRLGELVRAAGAELVHSGHLPDDPDLVRAAFADPPGDADLVLTSGGVSMGAHDVVKEVLLAAGTVDFVKVAMRPGMPQGAGHIGGRPIVTLPGNPVSSFVSFHVFVLPLLRRLAGQPAAASLGEEVGAGVVEAAVPWRSVEGKVEFTRVRVAGGAATPMTGQGSHMLGALGAANALAVVPPACAAVEVGQRLSVIRLLGSEVGS